jgi:hypothetical protein
VWPPTYWRLKHLLAILVASHTPEHEACAADIFYPTGEALRKNVANRYATWASADSCDGEAVKQQKGITWDKNHVNTVPDRH